MVINVLAVNLRWIQHILPPLDTKRLKRSLMALDVSMTKMIYFIGRMKKDKENL